MDNIEIKVPFAKTITLPIELFGNLPSKDAEALQDDLKNIYFEDHPEVLRMLVGASENNDDMLELKKDEWFTKVVNDEYAFDVEILSQRNDKIAERLVEEINKYNQQVKVI